MLSRTAACSGVQASGSGPACRTRARSQQKTQVIPRGRDRRDPQAKADSEDRTAGAEAEDSEGAGSCCRRFFSKLGPAVSTERELPPLLCARRAGTTAPPAPGAQDHQHRPETSALLSPVQKDTAQTSLTGRAEAAVLVPHSPAQPIGRRFGGSSAPPAVQEPLRAEQLCAAAAHGTAEHDCANIRPFSLLLPTGTACAGTQPARDPAPPTSGQRNICRCDTERASGWTEATAEAHGSRQRQGLLPASDPTAAPAALQRPVVQAVLHPQPPALTRGRPAPGAPRAASSGSRQVWAPATAEKQRRG